MRKIKYQGGLTKLIASEIGKRNKLRFAKFIERNLFSFRKKINSTSIEMDVVSFSSKKDFYDQVLSILSFLRYTGVPITWTLYSDGTHTKEQIQLLKSAFEFLKVEMMDWENAGNFPCICKEALLPYKDQLFDFAKTKPLGKKTFYFLNHPINKSTLFLDADILFYPKASVINLILKEKVNGWYLLDRDWGCLDTRYIENNPEQYYQVNTGFFLLNQEIENLYNGLEFLKDLNYEYEYFSEQTIFHIIFRANNFMPLDPRTFILDSGDQFDISFLYPKEKMAIRHYSGPVRHKMWQRDWEWQLSLT